MFAPEVRRGRVGIKIVSLNSGKVVFENDADKYFVPASNMKNFTIATAFERLGPDFRFKTSVYATAPPDSNGTVKGSLRIFGRGDVSISPPFSAKDPNSVEVYYDRIDSLADAIVAAGVKRIDGGLVADESYFTGNAVPYTWEWDDLQWYDGAEVSPLPINLNSITLTVRGTRPGAPCTIELGPPTVLYQVTNACVTGAAGSERSLGVKKALEQNAVVISGSMPPNERWARSITFTHPAELFVSLLKERLEKKGVVVTGGWRVQAAGVKPPEQTEIAKIESPPFSEIAGKTMKPSQNMFTETILWALGEEIGRKAGGKGDSSQLGIGVVRGFLQQAGIPADSVIQNDGSGMSRHDLVTPDSIVRLYTYMAKDSRNAAAWRASLAVGGIDGTLRTRFKGTAASENFRGKTGTLDQVSALSGYVTTAGGEQLVVSFIVNGVAETKMRTSLMDDIVVTLAKFNGKIDT